MISLNELKVKYNSKDGFAPKSGDEKAFRDKHKVKANPDRNGNGDDVFKASKVSTIKRSGEQKHGYDVDKDQDVYEEVEQATDSIPFGKPYKIAPHTVTDKSGAKHSPESRVKNLARQALAKMGAKKEGGSEPLKFVKPAKGDKVAEEIENVSEEEVDHPRWASKRGRSKFHTSFPSKDWKISHPEVNNGKPETVSSSSEAVARTKFWAKHFPKDTHSEKQRANAYDTLRVHEELDLGELDEGNAKNLAAIKKAAEESKTNALLKGRKTRRAETILKYGSLKKEEVEHIDELSQETLRRYRTASRTQAHKLAMAGVNPDDDNKAAKKLRKRRAGFTAAWHKIGEENEEVSKDKTVNEVLKPSMGAAEYIKDFVHSKDPKFAGKSKKQRMKQALAAYYSAKRGD